MTAKRYLFGFAFLIACGANSALADVTVETSSPEWVYDNNSTWSIPFLTVLQLDQCPNGICAPLGVFEFNQPFANAPGGFEVDEMDPEGPSFHVADITFSNNGNNGIVQFTIYREVYTNCPILCAFVTLNPSCSDDLSNGCITTVGGDIITLSAEADVDTFISFDGAVATPEPSLIVVIGAMLMAVGYFARSRLAWKPALYAGSWRVTTGKSSPTAY